MAITIWRDGRRIVDLPPVVETLIDQVILHRDEIGQVERGAVIADFSTPANHVDVFVQPAKIRLGGGRR